MAKQETRKTYYPYQAFLGVDPNTLMMLSQIAKQQSDKEYGSYTVDPGQQSASTIPRQTVQKLFSGLSGPLGFASSMAIPAILNNMEQRSAADTRDFEQMQSYRKLASVDPSYMALGGIPGPVPVQAEKGEVIVLPDGTSMSVNAKEKHNKQERNEITDIIPPDSFILSNDKRMAITRKQAETMVIGSTPAIYNEDGTGASPKDIKLSDIFRKGQSKATPAELMMNLEKKYSRSDREQDVYAEATKEENTLARSLYTEAIIALNMLKKNEVISNGSVPKAQFGANYAELLKQYQDAQRRYSDAQVQALDVNQQGYESYFRKANMANALSTGAGILFTGAQDSYVPSPQLNTHSFSEFKGLSQSQLDSQLNKIGRNTRNVANALEASGATPSQTAGTLAATTANIAEAQSNMMFRNNAMNAELLRRYYETRRRTRDQQSLYDTAADKETRAGANRKLGAIGNLISSGINTYAQTEAQKAKILGDIELAKRTAIAKGDINAAVAAMQLASLQESMNQNTPVTQQVQKHRPIFVPSVTNFNLGPLPPIDQYTLPKGVGKSGTFCPPGFAQNPVTGECEKIKRETTVE